MTPSPYDDLIAAAEKKYGIPAGLLRADFQHESGLNIKAVGDDGLARGIGQMHPAAAKTVGGDWDKYLDKSIPDAERAAAQIEDAAHYLSFCYHLLGDWEWALAAYNQGPTVISRGLHYAEAVKALQSA